MAGPGLTPGKSPVEALREASSATYGTLKAGTLDDPDRLCRRHPDGRVEAHDPASREWAALPADLAPLVQWDKPADPVTFNTRYPLHLVEMRGQQVRAAQRPLTDLERWIGWTAALDHTDRQVNPGSFPGALHTPTCPYALVWKLRPGDRVLHSFDVRIGFVVEGGTIRRTDVRLSEPHPESAGRPRILLQVLPHLGRAVMLGEDTADNVLASDPLVEALEELAGTDPCDAPRPVPCDLRFVLSDSPEGVRLYERDALTVKVATATEGGAPCRA